jgi:hypothetical protein
MTKVMVGFVSVLLTIQMQSQEIPEREKYYTIINAAIEETIYMQQKAIRLNEIHSGKESFAMVKGMNFTDGIIEVEVAGKPLPTANAAARGFIGIAFRLTTVDTIRYDCFYLRPSNGRADDQLRRNHSTQYIAHPSFPWYRLRKEFPGVYESYVDLVEGEWTKVRIEVKGKQAKLFVHGSEQPALIVTELLGSEISGGVALWVGQGRDGYFRNLKITGR